MNRLSKFIIIIIIILNCKYLAAQNTFPATGNAGIGTVSPAGKLEIVTGNSGVPTSIGALSSGSIAFANNNASLAIPTPFSKSSNSAGFSIFTGTNNVNASPDMRFVVMKEDGTDFTTLTSSAFRFSRYNLPLFDILRNGNIGIGTSLPVSRLSVAGSLTINGGLTNVLQRPAVESGTLANGEIRGYSNSTNSADDGFLRLSAGGGTNADVKTYIDLSGYSTVPDMSRNIVFGTSGLERLRIDLNGNVGIGTASPIAKFHIVDTNGGVFFDGSNTAYNRLKSTGTSPVVAKPLLLSAQTSGTTPDIFISTFGNVGIGTTLGSNKLDVNGTIHSKEVKVDMIGWSDFVFRKEYELPTLADVEKHIVEKGHLQNIPSEEEVLKNGISLGEMNAKLLQKIEELTMYAIEQNKITSKQSDEINDLKDQLIALKQQNEAFKAFLERQSQIEYKLK